MSGLIAIIIAIAVIGWLTMPESRPVIHNRRGLKMKAYKGRLVHVRETESEHEV